MAELQPSATGYAAENLPPGEQTNQIITLIRLGAVFRSHHVGRRRGFLHRYIDGIVARMVPPVTFDRLLAELEMEAVRRSADDGERIPIERVSRSFEIVKLHDPKHGEQQITFGRLKNILTESKRERIP